MISRDRICGLYAIIDTAVISTDPATAARRAILGGARVIQYRDKRGDKAARRQQAESLLGVCRAGRIPLIINDDVALARAVGADGVHLGRGDPGIQSARAELGDQSLIGVSCYNDLERARSAAQGGADYVAFGSFFPSVTKPAAVNAPVSLLTTARAALAIPIVAIGGITPENGQALIAAGADALAVISGIFGQADYCQAARRYAMLFEQDAAPETTDQPK